MASCLSLSTDSGVADEGVPHPKVQQQDVTTLPALRVNLSHFLSDASCRQHCSFLMSARLSVRAIKSSCPRSRYTLAVSVRLVYYCKFAVMAEQCC